MGNETAMGNYEEKAGMKRPSIRVDRDGLWYFQGREIIRKDILSLFYDSLHLDEEGYYIEINGEREYLEVEDTVFLVQGAELVREEAFLIRLNDGTQEQLDLDTLRITKENVPYCLVKEGRFPARFLRLPFYQVAQHAQHDEDTDEYFLLLNGRKYPLQRAS
ncbi:MAG: hypothetical protein A2Y65_01665 [Deltaproteobacteria bacterium RBG_13_52_11]|nr:MAG: hypothetical protein A2Y65_01665 [Deltaproteobacteria bacterium RBG_13_52_11]